MIDKLSIIMKSDHTNVTVAVAMLLYGCTTWTLTKRMQKKLDENYAKMLRAVLKIFWRQHSTKQQVHDHLPLISKLIEVRRARYVEHCWRRKDEHISDVIQ